MHDVIVQFGSGFQLFPKLQRMAVEFRIARHEIVGAHTVSPAMNDAPSIPSHGGVAPDVAAAQIALFQHRDIGDPVVLGQIVGGRQPVTAAADDHHIMAMISGDPVKNADLIEILAQRFRLRFRLAPCGPPALVTEKSFGEFTLKPE